MNRRIILQSAAAAGMGILASHQAYAAKPSTGGSQADAGKSLHYIRTRDGVSLAYKDWGTGSPVVFLHAWAMPSDMWSYQMVPLSERGWRCIAYDRRGHGRSSDPGRGYDFDTLADDLDAVLSALDLREVTLVAFSFSAGARPCAISPAMGQAGIARLALAAPANTPFLMKTADNPDGIDAHMFEHFHRNVLLRDYPRWPEENARAFVVADTSREMIDWLKGLMLQNSFKAVVDCNRISPATDFRPELARIILPTLIIHGDKDASAPIDLTGRRTAQMIRGAELKVYEGAPHGLFVTHMDRLNSDLVNFAKS